MECLGTGSKRFWTIANSASTIEQAHPRLNSIRLRANYAGAEVRGEQPGNASKPDDSLNDPAALQAAQSLFHH